MMMPLETVLSCPLGHKCEDIRDGKIQRCAWFVRLAGQNPQTGEQMDEHGCAMAWMPVLLIETAGAARGTSAAVESLRNETLGAAAMLSSVTGTLGARLIESSDV